MVVGGVQYTGAPGHEILDVGRRLLLALWAGAIMRIRWEVEDNIRWKLELLHISWKARKS